MRYYSMAIVAIMIILGHSVFVQKNHHYPIIAHAHNDYDQKKPLYSALKYGFKSIEVDIINHNGQLKVTHDEENLDSKKTISELYLHPMSEMNPQKLADTWLLIDIKIYHPDILNILHRELQKYPSLFKTRDGQNEGLPLRVILSGDVPRKEIYENDQWIYFFIDGRLSDDAEDFDTFAVPIISASFKDFSNNGSTDRLSQESILRIQSIIHAVHAQGKKMRFWGTKDDPILWQILIDLGIDVISIDHHKKFSRFAAKQIKSGKIEVYKIH